MLSQILTNNETQLNNEAELNPNNLRAFPRPITNDGRENSLSNPLRPLGPFAVNGAGTEQPSTGAIPPQLPPIRIPSATSLNREMVLSKFFTKCNICRQKYKAVARCYDCSAYGCHRCLDLHNRSKNTMGHTIYYWNPMGWSSRPGRFRARHVVHTEPFDGQHNTFHVYMPDLSRLGPDQPVTAPQLPPRSRVVGAERRSFGDNGLSDPTVSDLQNRGNSHESTVQELLNNIRMSTSYNCELSVQLISPGSGSPDHVSPHSDTLENQNSSNPLEAPIQELSPCPTHLQPLRLQCNDCFLAVCIVCVTTDHANHMVVPLESTQDLMKKLHHHIHQLTSSMCYNMDRMQYTWEQIDFRAHEIAIIINTLIKKCTAMLEGRQDNLMQAVNQIRQVKTSLVWRQMENIQEAHSKLTEISSNLNTVSKSADFQQKMAAIHTASKTISEIKSMHENYVPLEDDAIQFLNPSDDLLLALSTLGELNVRSAPITKSISLCSSPSSYMTYPVGPPCNILPFAKSRAIHGCSKIVAVKDYGRIPRMMFGKTGNGKREFCRPWGITVNRLGHLIVADRSNSRIQVMNVEGTFYMEFGSRGSGKGQFERPSGVAVSPNDDLVVADKDNHRIQVFNRYGEFLHMFGEKGSLIGQFLYPWDVACNKMGHIAVADARNHRIQLFQWNGVFITMFGDEINQKIPRLFDTPRGITFDPRGNIMMTDFNMHRVLIIDPQTGRVRVVGREGYTQGCFNRPQGIFCDDRGWFVVADSKNSRIQIFNEAGEVMWTVGNLGLGPRSSGTNGRAGTRQPKQSPPGTFDKPTSVCVDPLGHIYVMDFGNDRIQIF